MVNLEQVCSDFNFNVVVTYCSSFAEELPTKKEVEAVPFNIPLQAAVAWAGQHFRLNQGLVKADKEATDSVVWIVFYSSLPPY